MITKNLQRPGSNTQLCETPLARLVEWRLMFFGQGKQRIRQSFQSRLTEFTSFDFYRNVWGAENQLMRGASKPAIHYSSHSALVGSLTLIIPEALVGRMHEYVRNDRNLLHKTDIRSSYLAAFSVVVVAQVIKPIPKKRGVA